MTTVRHFTATGFVVHRERLLLHWHPKVRAWLPPGGHVDDNEDPVQAVMTGDSRGVRRGGEGGAYRCPAGLGLPRQRCAAFHDHGGRYRRCGRGLPSAHRHDLLLRPSGARQPHQRRVDLGPQGRGCRRHALGQAGRPLGAAARGRPGFGRIRLRDSRSSLLVLRVGERVGACPEPDSRVRAVGQVERASHRRKGRVQE